MKRQWLSFWFLFFLLHPVTAFQTPGVSNFIIVTYACDETQAKEVLFFVKSLRENGGKLHGSRVYICTPGSFRPFLNEFTDNRIVIVPLDPERKYLEYPLAFKAFAAARVEEILKDRNCTLAWFDPGTLILKEPDCLILSDDHDAVFRPVTLVNNIGVIRGEEPVPYWKKIYSRTGLEYKKLNYVRTVVGNTEILPYYNCEVFAVRSSAGILREWKDILKNLIDDDLYQAESCREFLKRLFLHQAVLSAVVISTIPQNRIVKLPLKCGYPFNQYERLDHKQKVRTLNECSVVIFDRSLTMDPGWYTRIPVTGGLGEWLVETWKSTVF